MSSSYSRKWTPDVFVSFKDKDVKHFVSTLSERLEEVGIGYRGYPKGGNLDIAICQARFALVVFSANYVNCRSCLGELVKILFRRGNSKYPSLVVIPIFHGMDRATVRELREKGEFTQALKGLRGKMKDEKKKEWSHALAEVEGISCCECKKDATVVESELIDNIVKRLVEEIRSLYSHKVFGPFGDRGETYWHFDIINGIGVDNAKSVESLTFVVPEKKSTKKTYEVKLKEEKGIISFSGYFQGSMGSRTIQALTFLSFPNKDKELTVGATVVGRKPDFSVTLPPDAGKVIEFFGSKNRNGSLTSIGARVELKRAEMPAGSCPAGLFGSRRGVTWDAKRHSTVRGIRALRDSSGNRYIRSIQFLFDDKEWLPDGSGKKWHVEFIIHDPDEYLSSISGYHLNDGITSLTFLTSKKSTITIGDGRGTHFSSPKTGYEIVGFYGWSYKHSLYGIGAYFKPVLDLCLVKSIGPFGRGIAWDDGKFKGVKKIHIFREGDIRYIKIVYDDGSRNDCPIIHGDYTGEFSNKEETVDLKYPQEYLTSITGYTGDDGSIKTLIFHSNRRRICFGPTKGKYFGYPSNKSRIIGFYGTYGKTLNSIGVHEEPIPDWIPERYMPFSGFGGTAWDDEEHSNVVGYRVTEVGESEESLKIESITFMYENNGSLVEGSRHGGGDPSSGEWVMLDFPKVRLGRIRGYWRQEAGETIIHDLKIANTDNSTLDWTYAKRGEPDSDSESQSKKKSETEWPKRFTILEKSDVGRRIVGFFGKAKTCLNSIGAHLEP